MTDPDVAAAREIVRRHFPRWDPLTASTSLGDDESLGHLCRSLERALATALAAQRAAGAAEVESKRLYRVTPSASMPGHDDIGLIQCEGCAAAYAAGAAAERERCARWHENQAAGFRARKTGYSMADAHDRFAAELRAQPVAPPEART